MDKKGYTDLITIQMKIDGDTVSYRSSETKDVDGRFIVDGLAISLSIFLEQLKKQDYELSDSLNNFHFDVNDKNRWIKKA